MIDIVLVRNSARPTIYGTKDPDASSIRCLHNCFCSPLSICSSFRVKVPQRKNVKIK